jgi:ornithine carbamoyltransferase
MKQSDLLSLADIDAQSIEKLLTRACQLQQHWQDKTMPQTLQGRRVGKIEELPRWRNPTALAIGVAAMGGTCVSVSARLEGAELVDDLAGYMDNWFDLMAVRTPRLSKLKSFADALKVPAMNLRTHDNHPCEVLGDLAYVKSVRGSVKGLQVAMVGPAGNIASSWFEAADVLGINVVQVTPQGFEASEQARGSCDVTDDIRLIEGADIIVTDCWPSDLDAVGMDAFEKCRIDVADLDRCKQGTLFVPCPPVTRGKEVSAAAMQHPSCVAVPAKAFLLHAQNAYVESAVGRA